MTPDQSAPPDEVGLCPGCNGHGGCGPLADCGHCGGTGRIRYSSTFTADEDRILRALIETGRPLPYAAVELPKPIPIVYGSCHAPRRLSRGGPGPVLRAAQTQSASSG